MILKMNNEKAINRYLDSLDLNFEGRESLFNVLAGNMADLQNMSGRISELRKMNKQYCNEADCEGQPGCKCRKHSKKTTIGEYLFKGISGCTDGNCIVKKPTGMHTNGGCKCLERLNRCSLSILSSRLQNIRDKGLAI